MYLQLHLLAITEVFDSIREEESPCFVNSSVIRQKGESQNGCFKKTKDAKFSKKRTFLTP